MIPVHPAAELFPMMEGEEFEALVEDIRKHVLREQPTVWEDQNDGKEYLIDGRNRIRALVRLGIKPEQFRRVGTSKETQNPWALALSLNVHRRHLTPEQKRELIERLLKAQPAKSDRQTAKQAKVHHETVGAVRSKVEARGGIRHVEKRTDTKGRKQPAKKAPGPALQEAEACQGEGPLKMAHVAAKAAKIFTREYRKARKTPDKRLIDAVSLAAEAWKEAYSVIAGAAAKAAS